MTPVFLGYEKTISQLRFCPNPTSVQGTEYPLTRVPFEENNMRIIGKLVLSATAGAFASLLVVSMPSTADAQTFGSIPGQGFDSNV